MSSAKNKAIDKARKLVALLKTNGIDVYEAYLFGSAAMDKTDEYSDIDIAIVSEDFTGIPDRKSTRLNSSHTDISRMPSSA